ncbi:uncharacterized protein LOC143292351 [Babylonia areolata]|uniref:uncharacterized protein LOC143292351 n=1 Tax=Babylonia areolata TaxID=304850 RepID=UPI003FD0B944
MRTDLLWLAIGVCLTQALPSDIKQHEQEVEQLEAEQQDVEQPEVERGLRCGLACIEYKRHGYVCSLQAGCFDVEEEAFQPCFQLCMTSFHQCQAVCRLNFHTLNDTCVGACNHTSIMAVDCGDDCLRGELHTLFSAQDIDLSSEEEDLMDDDDEMFDDVFDEEENPE